MKAKLKSLVVRLKPHPVFGRPVRFAIAVYRLPRMVSAYSEQLPVLLEAISRLNHRQHEVDRDKENVLQSVPVALRAVRQELNQLRSIPGALQNFRHDLDRLQTAITDLRADLDSVLRQLDSQSGSRGGSDSTQARVGSSESERLAPARSNDD